MAGVGAAFQRERGVVSDLTIKLPDEAGNVIELSVVRDGVIARRMRQQCPHTKVKIDSVLNVLTCMDCKADLNPIGWIVMLTEEWNRVVNLTTQLREATVRFDAKKRTRCEHCNKITSVKPATAAEVREFKKEKH